MGSRTAAPKHHESDTQDDQSDHNHADPSVAAHSITHSPSPASIHHAAAALTRPLTLIGHLGFSSRRETDARERG